MSEVLTLKSGTKRTFDSMDLDNSPVPCQQRRIAFLSPRKEVKRSRTTSEAESLRKIRSENCARTLPSSSLEDQREVIDKHVGRRRGRVNGTEKLFSLDDVKELVRRVLADRESQLQSEFRGHLNNTLAEQAEQFTKFSEAYVARQFRENGDVSYVS